MHLFKTHFNVLFYWDKLRCEAAIMCKNTCEIKMKINITKFIWLVRQGTLIVKCFTNLKRVTGAYRGVGGGGGVGVVGCGRPPLLPSGALLVFLIFLN